MRIENVGREAAAEWDAYVERSAAGTIFHRFGWGEAVEAGLGQESVRLAARRDGRIAGILPLVHRRSPLFGDALISVGFATYGGIVADDADDAAALRAIPRKGRRHDVKRSLGAGLEFVAGARAEEFHPVLAESYRNLGTPIFAAGFLRALQDGFPGICSVFLARRGREALSGCLAFVHKGAVHPFYAGGTAAARVSGANDFLYFNLMRHARAAGVTTFDFGRSRLGSGSHAYKRSWGFEARPLAYRHAMLRGGPPPRLDPSNPKFRLLVAAWKRLPLAVAGAAGPWIARQLG